MRRSDVLVAELVFLGFSAYLTKVSASTLFIPGEGCGISSEIRDFRSLALTTEEILNITCAFVTQESYKLFKATQPPRWVFTSGWSGCNVTCGQGFQKRTRVCQDSDGRQHGSDACGGGELTLHRSCLACPEGWEVLESASKCFRFPDSDTPAGTWHQGSATCSDMCPGSILAEPRTQEQHDFVSLRTDQLGLSSQMFLGASLLTVPGTWTWSSDSSPVELTFWHPGEPNNPSTEQCITLIGAPHFTWNDVPCGSYSAKPICEIGGDAFEAIVT